jgi:hypothetical protein
MDCLSAMQDPAMAPDKVARCRSQAASMMRQSQGALRLLLRLQAVRQQIEADGAALNRAEWTEHCAVGMMAQALPGVSRAPMAEPPPMPVEPDPEPMEEDEPAIDPIARAEEYARIYPQRAALIRRAGRLPDNVTFGPPEAFLVRALVNGRTPALLALDREYAETRAV